MNSLHRIFYLFISVIFLTSFAQAQGEYKYIDGWKVTYLGKEAVGSSGQHTWFRYRAEPLTGAQCSALGLTNCAGPLQKITLEVPSQYPSMTILDTSVNGVSRGNPGLFRDGDSGIVGIPFTFNGEQTTQDIGYTLEGLYEKADKGIWVGLIDTDSCANCCSTCGESGSLPGPKVKVSTCDTPLLPGNVVFGMDQHRCVSADGLQAMKNIVTNFALASDAYYYEKPKVSAQSYNYGTANRYKQQLV
jgi:hypothetical protein